MLCKYPLFNYSSPAFSYGRELLWRTLEQTSVYAPRLTDDNPSPPSPVDPIEIWAWKTIPCLRYNRLDQRAAAKKLRYK